MGIKYLSDAGIVLLQQKMRAIFNGYAACTTSGATAAKTASIPGFKIIVGARISVRFSYTNTASAPTLNVSGSGAKQLYFRGARITNTVPTLQANTIYDFIYTGTYYELVGNIASGYGL